MARPIRLVIPDLPHHITHRGNRGMRVFACDADFAVYYDILLEMLDRYHIDLFAYCFMPTHIHLIPVPHHETALSHFMRDTEAGYASLMNDRLGVTGHLWGDRFYSCVLDDAHLWAAVRYVERNPLRAGLVPRAENYRWSSASAHCELSKDRLLSPLFPPTDHGFDWRAWLSIEDDEMEAMIRQRTGTGRPCGSPAFIEMLEARVGKALMPKKPGPKPRRAGG